MFLSHFLGTQDLPSEARKLFQRFALLNVVGAFLGNLSTTFFILYAVDIIGFESAGIVISIRMLVQLVFDYPSGSLGDWIGQKWVLIISLFCSTVYFYLLAIVDSLSMFIILAIVWGFASAQSSGTLESWFDNNYQAAIDNEDSERKIYGFGFSRINSLNRIVMALSFVIGGFIATNIARQSVFLLQAVLCLVMIFLVLYLMNDIQSEQIEASKQSLHQYFSLFIGGIKFLISSKRAFFFLMGIALITTSFIVWGELILFPIYFGYSGSDDLSSLFRTIMFIIGIPIGIYMAKVTQKIATHRVSVFYIIGILFYYIPFIFLLTLLPPIDTFNITGLIITAFLLTIANNVILDVAGTLQGRTMIDLVPSENRNAVYSLIPSLFSLMGIPLLPITGFLIENYGLNVGIIIPFTTGFLGSLLLLFSFHFKEINTSQGSDHV
ncbi:MAG: MFS transporter [Candidatus Hodarchaeales archaeon]|jgi:MFS family permease